MRKFLLTKKKGHGSLDGRFVINEETNELTINDERALPRHVTVLTWVPEADTDSDGEIPQASF